MGIVGYARVSTKGQNLDSQIDALKQTGAIRVFTDVISGKTKARPGLEALYDFVREGDTVLVTRLARMGRSTQDLFGILRRLGGLGAQFESLAEGLKTDSATGLLLYNLLAALAQFEADLISERTKRGLTAARARGRKGGRKPGLSKEALDKAQMAKAMYLDPDSDLAVNDMVRMLEISKPTFYKYLRHLDVYPVKK